MSGRRETAVWLAKANGEGRRLLVQGYFPDWLPGGSEVVYVAPVTSLLPYGPREEGFATVNLGPFEGECTDSYLYPPDAEIETKIAVDPGRLMAIDIHTGATRVLAEDGFPDFLPDGQ